MQISVNLQDFIFSPIVFLLLFLLIILIMTIYMLKIKKKKEIKEIPEIKNIPLNDRKSITQKYIKKLNVLEQKMDNRKIELRLGYQELSTIIRHFVYEVTNIKVQNYTLEEIKKIDMPKLYELVREYYTPEFSEKSFGDIKSSIEKTRKVIEKWN